MSYTPSSSRLMKNTILLYFRMALMMCINLYTSRIVLETLGVEDFGIYNAVGGLVIMFGFLNGSMTVSTRRFLNFELGTGNSQRLHEVFITSLNAYLILSLIIILLGETIGLWFVMEEMIIPKERMPAALWCYHVCIFTAVIEALSCPYISAIEAHEKMKSFAYIAILDAVLKLLLVYLLLVFDYDRLILYALLYAGEKILIRMVYHFYCVRNFEECKYKWLFNKGLFKEMAIFAGWNTFGNLSYVCYTQGLNLLLNVFFGPIVNAARGVAAQVEGTVGNLANNFQTAITPQITKTYASGQIEEMHNLIYKGSRLTFCLLLIICLPLIVETPVVLGIWLKEVPDGSVLFLRFLLISLLVEKNIGPLGTAVSSTGKIKKYETLVNSIKLSILPTAYLVLHLGGAAWTVFAVYLVFVVLAYAMCVRIAIPLLNMSAKEYFTKSIRPCFMVLILSSVVPLALKMVIPKGLFYSLLTIFITVIATVIASYIAGLSAEEKTLLKEYIRKKVQ